MDRTTIRWVVMDGAVKALRSLYIYFLCKWGLFLRSDVRILLEIMEYDFLLLLFFFCSLELLLRF